MVTLSCLSDVQIAGLPMIAVEALEFAASCLELLACL